MSRLCRRPRGSTSYVGCPESITLQPPSCWAVALSPSFSSSARTDCLSRASSGARCDAGAEDAFPETLASDREAAVDDDVLAERARAHLGRDRRQARQLAPHCLREAGGPADAAAE